MVNLPLSNTASNRQNNAFDLLRIILAFFVFISHSYYLKNLPADITSLTKNQTYLGEIGLIGFFSLSGYLITKSFLNKKDLIQFITNRLLRIFPGFWMCLFVTAFIICPLIYLYNNHTLYGYQFTRAWSAYGYIKYNFFTYIRQPYIANILDATKIRNLNGSLWTLFSELLCYSITLVLGISGILKRKYLLLALTVFFQCVFIAICLQSSATKFLEPLITYSNAKLFMSYFIGSSICLFEKKLIQKWLLPALFLLMLLIFKFNIAIMFMPLVIGLFFLNIFSAFKCYLPIDISYGCYIYAFPIQILILICFKTLNLLQYMAVSFIITFFAATLSHLLIEKPALSLKHIIHRKIIFYFLFLRSKMLNP